MADDYYGRVADAKVKAREEDSARYGQTAASTPTDSSRYPTQRYSVMGGAVSDNFQTSSALIRDMSGGGKSKGYYIGDTLPDGSNIQDITTGRDGNVQVSVILPDGREAMLGSRQPRLAAPPKAPAAPKLAAPKPAVPKGMTIPKSSDDAMEQYRAMIRDAAQASGEAGMAETFDDGEPGEDDIDLGNGMKGMQEMEYSQPLTKVDRTQMLRDIMALKRY